jgi:hypothetical protein
MPENNAFGGNERLQDQYRDNFVPTSPLNILTVNQGGKYMNYSNQVGGDYLSQGDLLDRIRNGGVNALGSYDDAGSAYKAYMAASPYGDMQEEERKRMLQTGGSQQSYSQITRNHMPDWGQSWNPIFLPSAQTVGGGSGSAPAGTWDTPAPLPSPSNTPQLPAGTPQSPAVTPPSQFAWGNNPMYQNALMGGRDQYGEFGSKRGL